MLLAIPLAVELSVIKGVGGWGYPRSARVFRVATADCPLRNKAASSASEAADTTVGMIALRTSTAPLTGALEGSSLMVLQ